MYACIRVPCPSASRIGRDPRDRLAKGATAQKMKTPSASWRPIPSAKLLPRRPSIRLHAGWDFIFDRAMEASLEALQGSTNGPERSCLGSHRSGFRRFARMAIDETRADTRRYLMLNQLQQLIRSNIIEDKIIKVSSLTRLYKGREEGSVNQGLW